MLAPYYLGSKKLKNKVGSIAGGESGMGSSVAVLYAREGPDIAILYLDKHKDAKQTQAAVEKEGRKCIASRAGGNIASGMTSDCLIVETAAS